MALLLKPFRTLLLLMVGVPVAVWLLDRIADLLEAQQGRTVLSSGLRTIAGALQRAGRVWRNKVFGDNPQTNPQT